MTLSEAQAFARERAIREGNIHLIPIDGVPVEVSISGQMTTGGPYFFHVRLGPDGEEFLLFGAPSRALCRQAVPFLKDFLELFANQLKENKP